MPQPASDNTRRVALVAALVVVALGVTGLLVHRSHPTPAPHVRDSGVVSTAATAGQPTGSDTGAPGLLGTHSTALGDQSGNGTAPARVAIARLHLSTAVSAAGLSADGHSLDLPDSARTVVWWAYGARPGASAGTLLVAGHISWAGRSGTLGRIGTLHVGDAVSVTQIDGNVVRYRVSGLRQVAKMSLDRLGVFTTFGPPRLVLITCGGAYDAAHHTYADNVVVQALPVS